MSPLSPPRLRNGGETGQAFVETLLMIWLLTLLLSAIIQVFLVHNYTFQMANNAYYSLFKDKAYGEHNDPDKEFIGFPNWTPVRKPLRTVSPLQQAGGRARDLSGGPAVSWSEDDRAAVPMMPYFEKSIIEQLQNIGVTRAPVRLKIGSPVEGGNYLDQKFLSMSMGTEGGFTAFGNMIASIFAIARELGQSGSNYTDGYSEDDLGGLLDDYDDQNDDLDGQDPEAARRAWDEAHGDFNHDGYNDVCEIINGNNDSSCRNNRPW